LFARIQVAGDPIAVGVKKPPHSGPTTLVDDVEPARLEVGSYVDVLLALQRPGVVSQQREDKREVGPMLFEDDEQWVPTIFKFVIPRC
jgi:hypothetical protein